MNRLIRLKGAGFHFIICLGLILFFAANSPANNVPPSPTNSFYGDATGDMIIAAADIAQMNLWMLGFPYTYDTVQPQFPTQDWNTSDVTSDALIAASDLAVINAWMLGLPVSVPDKPWVLSNENLPLAGNATGTPIAFQINLASTDAALNTWGRAGIPVVARIDAAGSTTTGSLVGRTCTPIVGSRDQSTYPGDQCAIAVTVTDWYGAPGATKGLTETGTYGFSVIGNSGGNLRIVFSIDSYPPGLDIPAVSIAVITNIIDPINLPPTFNSTGPTAARQGLVYSYTPVITDADTGENLWCILGAINTCGGTLPADPPGPSPHTCTSYTFTPGAGQQTCQYRIVGNDNGFPPLTFGQTTTVTINRNPVWNPQPTNIGLSVCATYNSDNGNMTDVDVPAQTLSCSQSSTSCGFPITVTTTNGPGPSPRKCHLQFTLPGAQGSCTLKLSATDTGNPVAATDSNQITITSYDNVPMVTGPPPTGAVEGTLWSYSMSVNHPDFCQSTNCDIGPMDSCGGDVMFFPGPNPRTCMYSFTPGSSTSSCRAQIIVTGGSAVVQTDIIVPINRKPVFLTTAPTTATEGITYVYNPITITDPDSPAQTLTCLKSPSDTCGGTITGGPSKSQLNCQYSFTPGSSAQTCVVGIRARDNISPVGQRDQNTTVTINRSPTWNTLPTDITITSGSVYNQTNGSGTDPDTPSQALTCSKVGSDTCKGFDVTVSGSGSGSVNCNVSFTAGYYERCSFDMRVSDGSLTTTTRTVNIAVNGTKNWTVMVYLDGDNDLETWAVENFNEIELGLADAIAAGNADIQDSMNVIVMFDRITGYNEDPTESPGSNWTDTRLYRVNADAITGDAYFRSERLDDGGPGTGHIANLGERNMGDPAQLSWFMSYSKTNFPAAHYALIIWNHGGGTRAPSDNPPSASIKAVAWDDTSGDTLYLDEVQQAVGANFNSGNKLDLFFFDACLMQMVEVGYEFRNLVKYMVGSMNFAYVGNAQQYEYMFGGLIGARDESIITGADLSILFVEAYRHFIELVFPIRNTGVTMSVADLTQISTLATDVHALAVEMYAANKQTELETLRDTGVHFYRSDDESIGFPYYDLYDFCNNIYNDTLNGFPAALKTAANNVITSLSNTILFSYGDSGNGQPFYYGAGSTTHRGLSIVISRGNLQYGGVSHYAYQWWYTAMDTNVWWPGGHYYGLIDFCTSISNGVVQYWRELFEKWYDPSNMYTPSSY